MEIRKYKEDIDYERIIMLFKSENDWCWFLRDDIIIKHKKSLTESITYVVYVDAELIGYSRSIEDIESYLYVCELLVNKKNRGRSIGKKLLEQLSFDYPDHEILVMSDVDPYYKKLGYSIEGSIFKVSEHNATDTTSYKS